MRYAVRDLKDRTTPCCGVTAKPDAKVIICGCKNSRSRRKPRVRKLDLTKCIYRGEPTGSYALTSCPSSPKQPIFTCILHGDKAVRSPSTRIAPGSLRICAICFAEDDGYEESSH